MDKLKSCPFCGKKEVYINGDNKSGVCWVSCPNCCGNYRTVEEAALAWNTRAGLSNSNKDLVDMISSQLDDIIEAK